MLRGRYEPMKQKMEIQELIVASPLFSGLPDDYVQKLVAICERQELSRGKWIFSEGDAGNGFYLVQSGRVKIKGKEVPTGSLSSYSRAVESALGEALEALVAAEESAVAEAIRHLKETASGLNSTKVLLLSMRTCSTVM
jgi:hypothetical protein